MGRPTNYRKYSETSEKNFTEAWLKELSEFFFIQEQVTGIHLSGKKMIIDAIISPKNKDEWKNKNIAFGVEFKSPTKNDRLHNQMDFMKQCVDYSYTNFTNYGFIPILSCPRFEIDSTYSDIKSLIALRHFLNTFQVGELDNTYRGLSIIFADIHFIWEDGKVSLGKSWGFKKNFGCRK
jgi:hypothetical protein